MPTETTLAVLNELLAAEHGNLAPRLFESTVFVSPLTVEAHEVVRGMVEAAREHCAALTSLIRELGGEPWPRGLDAATADLHYQRLNHLLPRLIAAHQTLLRTYKIAAGSVGEKRRAVELIERIIDRHEADLRMLQTLTGVATTPLR